VEAADAGERQRVVVEVGGKRLEVVLPASLASVNSGSQGGGKPAKAKKRSRSGGAAAAASGNALTSPMQGTIVKVAVADGDAVAEGDLVVVLEAMKMEQPLTAHRAGIVIGLSAAAGETVSAGAIIALIEDAAAE
jgi:acetyl-CoA/propionyl-CoA carboxylase biotin carboxyl carrier protein